MTIGINQEEWVFEHPEDFDTVLKNLVALKKQFCPTDNQKDKW